MPTLADPSGSTPEKYMMTLTDREGTENPHCVPLGTRFARKVKSVGRDSAALLPLYTWIDSCEEKGGAETSFYDAATEHIMRTVIVSVPCL